MRFTIGLALLLTLVLLGNAAGPVGSGSEDSGQDDEHTNPPKSPGHNTASVLTPTVFTPSHNSVFWSGLAFTGVAWVMCGA